MRVVIIFLNRCEEIEVELHGQQETGKPDDKKGGQFPCLEGGKALI